MTEKRIQVTHEPTVSPRMNPCEICGETVAHEHSLPAAVSPIEAPPTLVNAAIGADRELSRLAHIVITKTVMECAKLAGQESVLDSGWQIPRVEIVDASLREYFGILLSESRQRVKPLVDAMLEAEKPPTFESQASGQRVVVDREALKQVREDIEEAMLEVSPDEQHSLLLNSRETIDLWLET
jgi:hypothetical protein